MAMRNFYLLVFVLLLCVGCQSNEEKANALIHKYLLEELYNYDSYEPIEFKFEEAHNIAFNDSICRQHAINIVKIRKDYQEGMRILTLQMEDAGLSNGYFLMELEQRYPEIYETNKRIDIINDALSKEIYSLESLNIFHNGEKHIGYSAYHKFRYKDSIGTPATGYYYFLFDKQLKRILYAADLNNEINKAMIDVLDQFCSESK